MESMGFMIDPEGLRARGSGLEQVGADSEGMFSGPRATLSALSPWGSDEGGAALTEAHAELTSVADEALSLFTQAMQASGANVRAMGDSTEENDGNEGVRFSTMSGDVVS